MRIYSLGVVPSERKNGLGALLVAEIEALARRRGHTSLTLEVGDSNMAAIALYRKCGFHQHGFRLGYYQDGGHALLLHKNLAARQNHDHPLYAGRAHQ
jgi:[ribosomal protein S18]-alanine N-acetyltransferase